MDHANEAKRVKRAISIEVAFLVYSFAIFAVTGAAKLASALMHDPILQRTDPILRLNNRSLLIMVGLWELSVALMLWTRLRTASKFYVVGSTALAIVAYRVTKYLFGIVDPCPCLGSLSGAVPLEAGPLEMLLTAIAISLLIGSIFLTLGNLRRRKPVATVS